MLQFRPHHFMCTLSFNGFGYDKRFVENYWQIVKQLARNPQTTIAVTCGSDAICLKCPNLQRSTLCKYQSKVEHIDRLHMEALHLNDGDILKWNEAKTIIKTHISIERFHIICASCEWKRFGICENALHELIDM